MAFPPKSTVQSIDDSSSDAPSGTARSSQGPPPALPKPRQAADSSLFSSAGKSAMDQSRAGLGAEGGSTAAIGMQGISMVQRGLQMLNLAFPDNPGLMAVLADITGRLQSIIPQLVAQQSNGAAGMGLFPQPQQAPMPAPPMGMPPGAPPMGAGGPPMPPMGQ